VFHLIHLYKGERKGPTWSSERERFRGIFGEDSRELPRRYRPDGAGRGKETERDQEAAAG